MATGQLDTVIRHIRKLAAASSSDASDSELLQSFTARRDQDAFAALVKRHGQLVWSVCRNVLHHDQDAEDAFQATFFVLARHAGSIRKREAVASWLHGVAFRSAMQVKRNAARRRVHEEQAMMMPQPKPHCEVAWRELQAVLDEEVQRLPAKFRMPFVLCCLQGKSKAEAAQELGWKEGTVSGRLAMARKLLRLRLARRGMMLSAALSAVALVQLNASAAVSCVLVDSTVPAAFLYAAGKTPIAGLAASLARGVAKSMFLTKLKFGALVLLILGLGATSAGILMHARLTAQTPEASTQEAEPKTVQPPVPLGANTIGTPKEVVLSGRVVDPAGNAVAGAKIYRTYHVEQALGLFPPAAQRATTSTDGGFQFTLSGAELAKDRLDALQIVAVAPGYGPGWLRGLKPDSARELTLRLVKDDVPINGRIVDLEGQPLAGVILRIFGLEATANEDLTPFIKALNEKQRIQFKDFQTKQLAHPLLGVPGLPTTITTDKDGRFQLRGAGRERIVMLFMSGPKVKSEFLIVMTRPGPKYQIPDSPTNSSFFFPGYGATFTHAATPPKPIVGTVRDKDTGKPLAGAKIQLAEELLEATSDQDGKYLLASIPEIGFNAHADPHFPLMALGPNAQPYLPMQQWARLTEGLEPITVDFELRRGLWAEGRVTDKVTGRPVQAVLAYFPFRDNPHARGLPSFPEISGSSIYPFKTRRDGTFRIAVLPGPGVIVARDRQGLYLPGPSLREAGAEMVLSPSPFAGHISYYHGISKINPADDAKSVMCNLVFNPGMKLTGTVLDPVGKPLAGAQMYGMHNGPRGGSTRLDKATFALIAYQPGQRRLLIFLHAARQLAGSMTLAENERDSLAIRLQPSGAVTGRLVDAEGQPRPNVDLEILFYKNPNDYLTEHWPAIVRTDHEGRFRVQTMIPGYLYQIIELGRSAERQVGVVARRLSVKSGEIKDLADVRTKPFGK